MVNWLWTSLIALPWWGITLWVLYTIYFVGRAIYLYFEVQEHGLWEGYKRVFIGKYENTLRLYHIIRMIIDIPSAIVGLVFPIIQKIFTLKLYEFKK